MPRKRLTPKECKLIERTLEKRGCSKAAVSRLAGQGNTFVADVLRGNHNPDEDQLERLASALGLTFVAGVPARIE